ncbi:MAG: HlyD family type I secretion periplasmic adaptor subunit [Rhodospirillales bacterium]|nr:HlyD family type I secretion periplasmic adaptor subunit [Rhodospirillales bacterium]
MQLSPRPSPKAISTAVAERDDPVLPAILEFQSPSTAIINTPVPRSARGISWMIGSMVLAGIVATAVIRVDRVVEAPGRETVKAGQVLARLDPTFAAADMGALAAQVAALQAQVSRLQAEVNNQSFSYSGTDPNLALQAAIYAQRKSEYNYKLENYRQKADSLVATIRRANSDMAGYKDRLQYAQSLEQMRKELEKLQVGSRLNTLAAMDSRAEMQRNLEGAEQQAQGAQRDLAALIAEREGYIQNWHADAAQQLADATSKLSDARENLNKAQLRRQLVELRADRDATVLTISKVSVGSVLQSGQQFITLVPLDAPLEVETNITGRDAGYVHVGDPVAIKFDTFPYTLYGLGRGVVRIVSADSFTAQDDQRNPTGALPVPQSGNTDPYYRARVTIDKLELHGVPEGFKVVPGMPVTADIKVGERTLFEYFFSRVLPMGDEAMREP